MCAYLFKDTLHQSKIITVIDHTFDRIESGYRYLLNGVFKVRPIVIVCVIGVLAACAYIVTQLHSELIPDEDQCVALGIGQAPTSSSKAYLEKTSSELADIVTKLTGSSSKIIRKNLPEDDPIQRKPDISLANKTISWDPQVPLVEGLKRTIEYFETRLSKE